MLIPLFQSRSITSPQLQLWTLSLKSFSTLSPQLEHSILVPRGSIPTVCLVRVEGNITVAPLPSETVLALFSAHGYSMCFLLSLDSRLLSVAVFSSWQCRCSSCRFFHSSLPLSILGILWSTSITSHSWKHNSHQRHLPFCCLSNLAFWLGISGCTPSLELQ